MIVCLPLKCAFVPGCLIHDNIILVHEIFHYLELKRGGNDFEFAFKMDMNKAFGRLEWNFIEETMEKVGFCTIWFKWIMKCVKCSIFHL